MAIQTTHDDRQTETTVPILLVSSTTCCTSLNLTGPGSGLPQIHEQKQRMQDILWIQATALEVSSLDMETTSHENNLHHQNFT